MGFTERSCDEADAEGSIDGLAKVSDELRKRRMHVEAEDGAQETG